MTHRTVNTLLAGAILLPVLGQAGDLSYTYVEAGYAETEIDVDGGGDFDGDGFTLAGSLAVAPNWHVFADFTSADFDFDVEATTIRVGGGYNYGINETTDVIARLSYVNVEVEVPTPFGNIDLDEDGFGIGVGLRGEVVQNFELEGAIDYVDLGGNDDGDTSFTGEGRYFITPMFAVGAGVEIGDDVTTYGITARLNFR